MTGLQLVPGGPPPARTFDPAFAALVGAALGGDQLAQSALVTRFERSLRGVTRFYRLSSWDADDVIQATWLQFLLYGRQLREHAALSGWLTTTARRQCLRVLQSHVHEELSEDPEDTGHHDGELDAAMLAAERRAALDASLAGLTDRQRELMTLLLTEPDLSYEEVGRRLGIPIGSIGPTRARSLMRLRASSGLQALR
jgi:RNA polymerase sigma factor (sigma-70 family)